MMDKDNFHYDCYILPRNRKAYNHFAKLGHKFERAKRLPSYFQDFEITPEAKDYYDIILVSGFSDGRIFREYMKSNKLLLEQQ